MFHNHGSGPETEHSSPPLPTNMKEPRRWVNTLTRQQKQTVDKGDQSLLKFVWLPSSPFSPPSLIFPSRYLLLWPLLTALFVFLHRISVWFVFIYLFLQGLFGHFKALLLFLSQGCEKRDRARRGVNLCVVHCIQYSVYLYVSPAKILWGELCRW